MCLNVCAGFDVVNVGIWIRLNLVNCFMTKKGCCSHNKRATILPEQTEQVVTDYVRGNTVIHGKCGLNEAQAPTSHQALMEATIHLDSDVFPSLSVDLNPKPIHCY